MTNDAVTNKDRVREIVEYWDLVIRHLTIQQRNELREQLSHALAEAEARGAAAEREIQADAIDACRTSPLWMHSYDELAKRTNVPNALAAALESLAKGVRQGGGTPA